MLPEDFSQRRYLNLQIVLFDDDLGPDAREQLVFGDKLAGALDQRQQHIECAGTGGHRLAIGQQAPLARLDNKAPETVLAGDVLAHGCRVPCR